MFVLTSVWPGTVEGWCTLIGLIIGLIGAIAALIPTIIKLVKSLKTIVKDKNWAKIKEIAKAAMKSAEESKKSGSEKKELVINAVKAGCSELGIEIDQELIDNLSKYIDDSIDWFNAMKKKED